MNGVAIAGMSLEKGHGFDEIFALLGDGDAWVVANVCESLINSTSSVKQSPTGKAGTALTKLTIASWNQIGASFAQLPSDAEQRLNVLKFLANSLSHGPIIANFIKSTALGSLCASIWSPNTSSSSGRSFSSSSEEKHALLVVMNNLVASSKGPEWRKMCEDANVVNGLASIFASSLASNDNDRLNILLQIVNSMCQESIVIDNFVSKDKPFGQSLLKMISGAPTDAVMLRLSRLCGTLMQNYDPLKILSNGGVFKFYARCLSNTSVSANNEEIVMAILATLANLALSDKLTTALPQQMEEARLLHSLQELFTRPTTKPNIRVRCGITISNLMTLETLQAPFAQAGGIKSLVNTANKHNAATTEQDAEVFQKALSALFHMSLYYDSMRSALVQEGSLKSLGSVLASPKAQGGARSSAQSSPTSEALDKARQAAMKTLYNISMTDGHEAEFVKQNVVGPLIGLLKANEKALASDDDQQMSAAILENLAGNPVFHEHLRTTGGIEAIVGLVTGAGSGSSSSTSSPKVQERAAKLIARLAINPGTRQYLQKMDVSTSLKKVRSSSSPLNIRSAIEAALHNVAIPVESESDMATPVVEEDALIAQLTQFDLDDDGSIASLDQMLHSDSMTLSLQPSTPTAAAKSAQGGPTASRSSFSKPANAINSPNSARSPPPSVPSRAISPPPMRTPQQQTMLSNGPSSSPTSTAGGPPALPPKPPPKPSAKKINAMRRAIGSQPVPQRNGKVTAARPKAAMFAPVAGSASNAPVSATSSPALVSSGSNGPRSPRGEDETFEDRGIRKESYLLAGDGDTASPSSKKKKGGLFSSLKSLFSSTDEIAPESKIQLHEGPWRVDEAVISQKCPCLIYDYFDHWCENCKRNGSLCEQSFEELRRLRMRLIRAKEAKSFAPESTNAASSDAGRVRSNSDPALPSIAASAISQSPAPSAPMAAPQVETPSNVASASPPVAPSPLQRPPPPEQAPPIMSLPIPPKMISPPKNRVPNGSVSGKAVSPPTSPKEAPPALKMPSHPPQPSLASDPPKKALPADMDPEAVKRAKMHVKRTHIAQELLTTEGTYMQNLGIILKKFQAPLVSSLATPKPLVSEADIRVIFGSVEIIYNINMVLIEKLNMKMRRWTSKQTLGDVFIYMADWLKIYTDYINNYDKSQSALLRCKEDNPRFAQFLMDRTLDPVCALRGLETFLVTPIQRPPRYSLLLRELIKNTDENHPDWKDLNQASVKIEEITTYLNEKRREFESRFKMFELAHSLTSSKIRAEIVQPHRENLLQANVDWRCKAPSNKHGVGRLYLLNDAFLLTKTAGKTRQKLARLIPHKDVAATIPDIFAGNPDDPHLKELTLLHIPSGEFILVVFEAVENRDQMYNHYLRVVGSK
jgi:hypothetical protein